MYDADSLRGITYSQIIAQPVSISHAASGCPGAFKRNKDERIRQVMGKVFYMVNTMVYARLNHMENGVLTLC
jgi:hypothetical protein